jgi:hypothetical protein
MPDLADRRDAPRLFYDHDRSARLMLQGQPCAVLDLGRRGVRYELPALPVRPAASAIFEAELELACGERVAVCGRVVRTHGHVAAAQLDPIPLTDLQLAREREHLRIARADRDSARRRWRPRPQPMTPHEPRRSEA